MKHYNFLILKKITNRKTGPNAKNGTGTNHNGGISLSISDESSNSRLVNILLINFLRLYQNFI